MAKKVSVIGFLFLLSLLTVLPAFAGGRGSGPVVYVESQGLFYDSIVVVGPDPGLPMEGPFQKLETDGGLATQYGPGDPGYVGGRWWVDANEDGEMNEGDVFFLCPLLGPGRASE
jgi:hypothetical protein